MAGDWPTPLAGELAGEGPMPVRDLMAEALYAPRHGFYTRRDIPRAAPRPSEDPSYLRELGARLAAAFEDFAVTHAPRFVEQGPGSGRLARSVLAQLPEHLRAEMQLVFIEPLLARRTRLVSILHEFGIEGSVVGSPRNLEPGPGFVVAKELVSAFPVHQLERTADGWREVHVRFAADRWAWEESLDTPPPRVRELAPDEVPVGHRYELNVGIAPWLGELAAVAQPAFVVVLDRFAGAGERGSAGSLRAVRDGELVSPYEAPGETELSAAVDPAALEAAAQKAGFKLRAHGFEALGAPHLGSVVLE